MTIRETTQSLERQITRRITRSGRGAIFSASDFLPLGKRPAIDVALSRLAGRGVIRRLARGLYDYPRLHARLGELHPSPEEVARALATRDGVRLQPAGAHAANLLGLSDQVPARIVYLTDGPSRLVRIGKMTIQLRRSTPRTMATAGRFSGLLIQGLRFIGRPHVGATHVARVRRSVPPKVRRGILRDLRFAPAWMHSAFRLIAAPDED